MKNFITISQKPGHDFPVAWKLFATTIEIAIAQYVKATIHRYERVYWTTVGSVLKILIRYFPKIIKIIHNHKAETNDSRIDFLNTSWALWKFPAHIFWPMSDIAAIPNQIAGKYAKNSKRNARENAVAQGSKNFADTI